MYANSKKCTRHAAPNRATTRPSASKTVASLLPRLYNTAVQISVVKDKTHRLSPWLVVLPARVSANGRRQYKRFHTRGEAEAFLATVRRTVRANGEKAHTMLPAQLAADAAAAASLLEGTGLSLSEAVRKLLAYLQNEAVACAQHLPSRGTGNETATPAAAPLRSDLTICAALELLENARAHHSPVTVRARRYAINALMRTAPQLNTAPLETISTEDWLHILTETWPESAHCFNSARRHVHAIYAYTIRRRILRIENPLTPIDLKHINEGEITALPPADLIALFNAARNELRDLRPYIALCAFAGIRPTECTRLRWQDVNFEENVISVRHGSSKTGGPRHIHMHSTLRAWLELYKPKNAAQTDLITPPKALPARLTALRTAAGFNKKKPWQKDCLRHSYATYYLKAQHGSITDLQLNMGHRSTLLLYTRYTNMAGVTNAMAAKWWTITPSVCKP